MQVRVYNILFKFMFIFLIALKSQVASNDWQKTSSLLAQTLASIANQTNGNFKTVVVCIELLFTGVIYNRCNGENFAATTPLKQATGASDPRFNYQPITSLLKQTFTFVHN